MSGESVFGINGAVYGMDFGTFRPNSEISEKYEAIIKVEELFETLKYT